MLQHFADSRTPLNGRRNRRWLAAACGLPAFSSHAGQGIGDFSDYAAGALMLVGLLAVFLGISNLRVLRHKQALPPRDEASRLRQADTKPIAQPRGDAGS